MSIAIVTASWKRPDMLDRFLTHCTALGPVAIVCAGSPDDECAEVAAKHRVTYEQVPNVMNEKWNHAAAMALKTDATHFLFLGSDDFMSHTMWVYYSDYEGDQLSLRDLCFHNTRTRGLAYWPGYRGKRKDEPIGAAKLLSRRLLELLMPYPFGKERRPRGLDRQLYLNVTAHGVTIDIVNMSDTGGICVDAKGPDSMTKWTTILAMPGTHLMPAGWLKRNFPELHRILK